MDHRLVSEIEKALGWTGPKALGESFARGRLADPDLGARLMTPTRMLDLIMRRQMTASRLQLLQGGAHVHPQRYLRHPAVRRGESPSLADMDRIGAYVREGCTLVLDRAHTYDPTLEVACRALQWWAHEVVMANLYLTTSTAAGFQLHWDDHDVVIVQLGGRKGWEVRGMSREAPLFIDSEPNLDPPTEVVWRGSLGPGDVMHIPRGYWHAATREDKDEDGYSLHVTFSITKRTGVDWFSWLADQSRYGATFRRDIKRWADLETQGEQARELTHGAVMLATTRTVQEFVRMRERLYPAARHVQTFGQFGEPKWLVCIAEFRPEVERDGDRVTIHAASNTATIKADAWPVMEQLLSGRPIDVDELAAEHGEVARELAALALRRRFCAELTPELRSGYADLVL